jgi:hypothetical protein
MLDASQGQERVSVRSTTASATGMTLWATRLNSQEKSELAEISRHTEQSSLHEGNGNWQNIDSL